MDLLSQIKEKAKGYDKRIVLPEGFEDRTLKAADEVIKEGIARIILIGDREKIFAKAKEFGLKHIDQAEIINPLNHPKKNAYVDLMVELRKSKGLTKEQANHLIETPQCLGAVMIKAGDADGEVSGAMSATSDVLRPAFQYVKTRPGISVVSGAFLMILPDKHYGDNGVMVFADCAVNPNPNEHELAEIAISTAKTARTLAGIEPRIAMLSFSTKGSAKHELVDKVVNATRIAKEMDPTLQIDGEMQADAALVESVAKSKAPGSSIAGKANVLVFPDLQSGNISYKLLQRIAHAEAIGPILQGMAAPINDLSRGCFVSDIVNVIAIAVNQAAELQQEENK